MPTIAESWVQEGIEKGIEKGRLQESQETILENLEIRFGTIPKSLSGAINKIEDLALLKNLRKETLLANSISEFQQKFGHLQAN